MPNYLNYGKIDLSFTEEEFISRGVNDQEAVVIPVGAVRTLSVAAFNLLIAARYPLSVTADPVTPDPAPFSDVQQEELLGTFVPARTTAPDPTINPSWVDTSTSPPVYKTWNGTSWTDPAFENALIFGGS